MARSTSNVHNYYLTLPNITKRLHQHLISPPMLNLLFRNKQGLLYNADLIPFKKNTWNENPMQFCIEQYTNQHLFPVILVCNNIGTIYDFNSDTLSQGIWAPLIDTINRIIIIPPLTEERY